MTLSTNTIAVTLGPNMGHLATREDGPGQPLTVPDADHLADALRFWAQRTPDNPACYFIGDKQITELSYADLLAAAERFAASMQQRGLAPHHAVLICGDTCAEVLVSFLACTLAGAVPVLVAPPRGISEVPAWRQRLGRFADSSEAFGLVADPRLAAVAAGVVPGFVVSTAELAAEQPAGAFVAPASMSATAFIQFSSGTTSDPKGVNVTQAALIANVKRIANTSEWTDRELVVGWLPLYHDMGLVGMTLAPLFHGRPVALMSPLRFLFNPRSWMWAIHYFRATLTVAPNFAYHICATKVKPDDTAGLDLSSLRVAYIGAEAISKTTVDLFGNRYEQHGCRREVLYPVYGMAETVLAATFPRCGRLPVFDNISADAMARFGRAVPHEPGPGSLAIASVGRALSDHEIRVVDDHGNEVDERVRGHIILRGPSVCPGYVNNEAQTSMSFRDGWLHTGDLGYLADGELYVCGRSKDLIIRAGANYHPYELEASAGEIPGVRTGNVAAFAVPSDETGTERLVVVFETRIANDPDRKNTCSAVAARLHEQFGIRPDWVVAAPPRSLPKTSSGKMQRATVRDLLVSGRLQLLAEAAAMKSIAEVALRRSLRKKAV